MVQIYWNNYDFNLNKKYAIYYFGNFSPPHKGHFNIIKPFLNRPNIKIIIKIFGDELRHGIPLKISKEIFDIYLRDVNNVFFDDKYLTNIDYVIFLRGSENFNIKSTIEKLHGDLIRKLRKKGILSEILIVDRIPSISSTELCKNISEIEKYLPEHLSSTDQKTINEKLHDLNIF